MPGRALESRGPTRPAGRIDDLAGAAEATPTQDKHLDFAQRHTPAGNLKFQVALLNSGLVVFADHGQSARNAETVVVVTVARPVVVTVRRTHVGCVIVEGTAPQHPAVRC